MYSYQIDQNNGISFFKEGSESPFQYFSSYPNGDSFESEQEAASWADLFIASIEIEDAPYPPVGKGIAGLPKLGKARELEMLRKSIAQMEQRAAALEALILK